MKDAPNRGRLRRLGVLSLLLLPMVGTALAAALPAPVDAPLGPQPWGAWTLSHVENDVQFLTSLAVSPDGTAHVFAGRYCCYRGSEDPYATATDLVHYEALPGAVAWRATVVDVNAQPADAVADPEGRLHVSYQSGGTSTDLRYARRDVDGTWTIEEVEVTPQGKGSAFRSSIAVAPDGTVHIVYQDTRAGFKHAWRAPQGGWTTELVASGGGGVAMYSGVAVDAAGRVHVVWDREPHNFPYLVMYAVKDPLLGWVREVVPFPCVTDFAIAVDAEGSPHLTCYHGGLRYLHRSPDGTGWASEWVETGSLTGEDSSVQVDSMGRLHVSYSNFVEPRPLIHLNQGYVYYAQRDPGTGQWIKEVVDGTPGRNGLDTKLALDPWDVPRVAYVKFTSDPFPYCPLGYLCFDIRYAEPTLGTVVRGAEVP